MDYEYDGSGNLVYDRSEHTLIKWNAQGKVAEVRKDQFGVSQTTKFWYNAAGNRVKKQVINHLTPLQAPPPPPPGQGGQAGDTSSVTYYVRDVNEAVMAIYQQTVLHGGDPSGCVRVPNNIGGVDMDMDGLVDAGCDKCTAGMPPMGGSSWNPWQEDYDKDGIGDACDPCPFVFGSVCAAPEPGVPPQPGVLPQAEVWSGTAVVTKLAELPIYGSERLGLMRPNVLRDTVIDITRSLFTRRVDQKEYELKDHLGNVRVVVSDMKTRVTGTNFTLIVKSVNNYYAFGMLQEGMSGSSGDYRYGFNGKESDNEVSGTGNQYDYGFRIYNPRLGKFLSVDPLTSSYPMLTPYQFASNTPIQAIDLDGLEAFIINNIDYEERTVRVEIRIVHFPVTEGKKAIPAWLNKYFASEEFINGMKKRDKKGHQILDYDEIDKGTSEIINSLIPEFNKDWKVDVNYNTTIAPSGEDNTISGTIFPATEDNIIEHRKSIGWSETGTIYMEDSKGNSTELGEAKSSGEIALFTRYFTNNQERTINVVGQADIKTIDAVIYHEYGHNAFGEVLTHTPDYYPEYGVGSNYGPNVYPTKTDTKVIIEQSGKKQWRIENDEVSSPTNGDQ